MSHKLSGTDMTLAEANAEVREELIGHIKDALLDDPERLSTAMLCSDIGEWSGSSENFESHADLCATIYRAHRVIERLMRGDSMEEIMRTMDLTHWRAFVRAADTIKANLDTILDDEVAEHLA